MTTNATEVAGVNKPSGWQEFWSKEDKKIGSSFFKPYIFTVNSILNW